MNKLHISWQPLKVELEAGDTFEVAVFALNVGDSATIKGSADMPVDLLALMELEAHTEMDPKEPIVYDDVELVTCSCGVPACAGVSRGIRVIYEGSEVLWEIPSSSIDKALTPHFPRELVFDRKDYREAMQAFVLEMATYESMGHRIWLGPYELVWSIEDVRSVREQVPKNLVR